MNLGENLKGVVAIISSTGCAFAAIPAEWRVVTWGDKGSVFFAFVVVLKHRVPTAKSKSGTPT